MRRIRIAATLLACLLLLAAVSVSAAEPLQEGEGLAYRNSLSGCVG